MSSMPQDSPSGSQGPPGEPPAPEGGVINWQESPLASGSARRIPVPAATATATQAEPADEHAAAAMAQRPRTMIMLEPLRTSPPGSEPMSPEAASARAPVPALDDPEATVPPLSPGGGTSVASADADDASPFDHAPPFAPRRNMARVWTIAALVFAAALLALTAATAYFGLPDWLPGQHRVFGEAHSELRLSFPPERQERRKLPGGADYFGISGSVTNVGRTAQHVPGLRLVLRDAAEQIVYQSDIAPPRRDLAPGESMTINEARTQIPASARSAEIGWKPE